MIDAAAMSLVMQMTGDDCAERHLSNAARSTAPPGELSIDVAAWPCLDFIVHISDRPARQVGNVELLIA